MGSLLSKEHKHRLIIMGAAGRDFHDFNVFWKHSHNTEVVAFTATQIPNIEDRTFPAEYCGPKYPHGIKIHPEDQLETLVKGLHADLVALSYSDLPFEQVMHQASRVQATGADFILLGPHHTMIQATKPVIAICATRTGCGKSQTARVVSKMLKNQGKRVAVIRHPMPYGDLSLQRCQRFATLEDLTKHKCTIEEMEEYEPHIAAGNVLYAGVDYELIVKQACEEADVILWDGGNNDTPFVKPTLFITIADAHRADHGTKYYPGETNLRMADIIIINKVDTATATQVAAAESDCRKVNPNAPIYLAESPPTVADPCMLKGKKVLVIEDGPSVTHGGMPFGAGFVAAEQCGAAEYADPVAHAVGSLQQVFARFGHLAEKRILPAMGYSPQQVDELEQTVNATPCDVVVVGTPIDLRRVINIDWPTVRVHYNLKLPTDAHAAVSNAVAKAAEGCNVAFDEACF